MGTSTKQKLQYSAQCSTKRSVCHSPSKSDGLVIKYLKSYFSGPALNEYLTFLNISKKDRNPPPTPAGRSLLWFAPDSTAGQLAKSMEKSQYQCPWGNSIHLGRQFTCAGNCYENK